MIFCLGIIMLFKYLKIKKILNSTTSHILALSMSSGKRIPTVRVHQMKLVLISGHWLALSDGPIEEVPSYHKMQTEPVSETWWTLEFLNRWWIMSKQSIVIMTVDHSQNALEWHVLSKYSVTHWLLSCPTQPKQHIFYWF